MSLEAFVHFSPLQNLDSGVRFHRIMKIKKKKDPHEQDIIEKMMLSIGQGMKCRGTVLRNAYEELLALFKLKRSKEQGKAPQSNDFSPNEHQDHYYDDMTDLLQLIPYEASMSFYTQPSAPPLLDSANNNVTKDNNLLAYFEVHEQVDFRGKGLVDNVYVPWLEQVCNIHPSLIDCQRNRTHNYAGWAFNALGRVLHYLGTTRVNEMDDEACECLQMLWDEVQVFGFDLSWLEPQVEFALKFKGCVEGLRRMENLEGEKRSLEVRIREIEKEIEGSKANWVKWQTLKRVLRSRIGSGNSEIFAWAQA